MHKIPVECPELRRLEVVRGTTLNWTLNKKEGRVLITFNWRGISTS